MALSMRDCTTIKVVQATHHQGDIRYGTSRGITRSCMSLVSVIWILFRFPGVWDKFNLDFILIQGGNLFIFIQKFRYLGMEDLLQVFLVENSSLHVEFIENNTEEITTEV